MKKSIRQKTVVEQLMQEIRQMITDGAYNPEQRFPTEQELAEQFNVGRSSVREAIKTLSHLGVLESHTSQGTYISKNNRIAEVAAAWSVILGYEKMKEVFALGTALDTQVALILLDKIKKETLEVSHDLVGEVETLIFKMRNGAEKKDFDSFHQYFALYFRSLYEATGNMVFIALNECIESLIVKKVCDAYYQTGRMCEATNFLKQIWTSILQHSKNHTIDAIQNYGVFAYESFQMHYGE